MSESSFRIGLSCFTVAVLASLILVAPTVIGHAAGAIGHAAGAAPFPQPERIVQNMLDAQSGLQSFTADVRLTSRVGVLPLPPISGRISSQRPNLVKIKAGGVTFTPRHPFLFPDPLEFTTGKYVLSLAGDEQLDQEPTYVVDVTPMEPEESGLQMRFWISKETWLIVQSDIGLAKLGHTVMKAKYVSMAERAWVPAELSGQGGLLLLDLLPALGLGQLLNGLDLSRKITFRAVLTNHSVNAGPSGFAME